MKINIIVITYNHANYICQAMDSIMMQEIPHDVELIIADDNSTDDTLAKIKQYTDKSSFKITFLPKERNLGFVKNYKRAFDACDGKYIAIMEGDDYWTSPLHIKHHVDFLENHPDYSVSFNRHIRFFQDQDRTEIFEWNNAKDFETITTAQLALGNRIGNLSCCVFRTGLIKKLAPELFNIEFADWLLGMIMGQYGPLAYQKEVTSLYRIHDNGQWSRMNEKEQGETLLEAMKIYDKILDYKYTDEFAQHTKRINIGLYGDKSFRGRIKSITPESIRKIYRKIRE